VAKVAEGNRIDKYHYLRKSYRKDGIYLKVHELPIPEQKELFSQLFHAHDFEREFIVKRFLARRIVAECREKHIECDPKLIALAKSEFVPNVVPSEEDDE